MIDVSGVSASGADALTAYQYGRTDGPTLTSSDAGEDFSNFSGDSQVNQRVHVVWGLEQVGGASGDVTVDFSGVDAVTDPSSVVLLKREGPGAPWTDVTGSWTRDASTETFTRTGVGTSGQYAVAGNAESLPVELAGFEGRQVEGGVRLTWQTASEENNAGFRVQRRAGEGDWTKVGSVEGAGTTDEPQRYRFTDEDLPYAADSVRYRLKQVDLDGTTSYSDPVVVDRGAVEELQLLGTAPNPASSRATVRFAVPEGTDAEAVTMRLYDVLGRAVRTVQAEAEAGRHELQLDVNGLGSGTYFLRLRGENAIKTQKVTVVR